MSAPSREVLVIGAGIAGLTAARDLAVDGYDVAILEARERTGPKADLMKDGQGGVDSYV